MILLARFRIFISVIMLCSADIIGLYPSMPHELDLKALRNTWENRNYKEISIGDLIKMAEFVLKNNYFEFDSSVLQQIADAHIGINLLHRMSVFLWINIRNPDFKTLSLVPFYRRHLLYMDSRWRKIKRNLWRILTHSVMTLSLLTSLIKKIYPI